MSRIPNQSTLALALALAACAPSAEPQTGPVVASSEPASIAPVAVSGVSAPHGAPAPAVASKVEVTKIARGLAFPWALAFLPDGRMLVTERPGTMRFIAPDGAVSAPLAGVPEVYANGQGGLLDVALAPSFAQDSTIFFSYAEAGEGGLAGTALAKARLSDAGLEEVEVIFRQAPKLSQGGHFGSRIVFDGQNHVFLTLGENQQRPTSQKLAHLQGKVVRLNLDGSIPADNPFVGRDDARAEIWSYGHRNSQGAALHPATGQLWMSEHGPRGGDEINLPKPGANHGWPFATFGINYSGDPIPESVGTQVQGAELPLYYFERSPALSGMAFYSDVRFPQWQNSLFLGGLASRDLIRLQLDGRKVIAEERLLGNLGARIRDVRTGPDGFLYVLTDEADGKLLRIGLVP